jgi:small subunit ribosomal protein S2
VLFVGTKRQAAETVQREAQRCGMPYVNTRWLGGTMTNWSTIRSRIDTLKKLTKMREEEDYGGLTKKEILMQERELEKLELRLGGLRDMKRLPDLLIVVDPTREDTAVLEANKLNIPVLSLADTDSDPDLIDFIIPGNDDAMRSIRLVVGALADAVLEGKAIRKGGAIDEHEDIEEAQEDGHEFDEDASDDELLGESTRAALQKLRSSKLDLDEEDEDE